MAYINNFSNFERDDVGIPIYPNKVKDYPLLQGIQKASINTIDSFCLSPYGAVSNLNCPDWDPSCNCWITQYMPTKPEPSGISLQALKIGISECDLIKQKLNKGTDQPAAMSWLGIDYSDPYALYNCPNCKPPTKPTNFEKPTGVEYYKISYQEPLEGLRGKTAVFPYSEGLLKNNGITLNQDWIKVDPQAITDDISGAEWECTGGCFPYYMEYSKTNATFWRTPLKTPLLRRGQVGSYNAQKIKILVNGDSRIKAGSVVTISAPIGDETDQTITQKRFSGRWLVYRVERVFTTFKHSMFLFLMRDGFAVDSDIQPTLGKSTLRDKIDGGSYPGYPAGGDN
jgi:hypothetical protein